jgi:glycosyltransferase involved in cell wall biosynthesis
VSENKPKISVVIPVFNSAKTLPVLVSRIETVLKANCVSYELILVDDCSKDDSWSSIKSLCNHHTGITGIRLTTNYGQWVATLAGLNISSGHYLVTIDDDLEYQPEDIITLYSHIKTSPYKVVFGIASEKYTLQSKSRIISIWRNRILNFIWNKPITDSFKIFYRDVIFRGDRFDPKEHFESYLKKNLSSNLWGYIPVKYCKRKDGNSNYNFLKKFKLFFIFSYQYWLGKDNTLNWHISETVRTIE